MKLKKMQAVEIENNNPLKAKVAKKISRAKHAKILLPDLILRIQKIFEKQTTVQDLMKI